MLPEIKFDNKIATTPEDRAEAFNCDFTRTGENLASKIAETQIDPISYLKPVNKGFALGEIEILDVNRLLKKINVKKDAGLDNILCYLLKIAANIVSPSLTSRFRQSIVTGIFPESRKMAKVPLVFKSGK